MKVIGFVVKHISQELARSLSEAIKTATGIDLTFLALHSSSPLKNGRFSHWADADVLHFSSLECLLEASIDSLNNQHPLVVVDITGNDKPLLNEVYQHTRLFAVHCLAHADHFICSNQDTYQGLLDFGIDDRRMILDPEFIGLESIEFSAIDEMKVRLGKLARAYHNGNLNALRQERGPKPRVERKNGILLMKDLKERRLVWESKPGHIEFSTNNRCNLRCIMCSPRGRTSMGELPESEVRAIANQVFPAASILTPSAGSEPLLGNLALITELCKTHGVQVNLITNGTLLNPDRYEEMKAVLGRIHISFDSHEKELYERIRRGARFETVVENIRALCIMAARDNVEVVVSAVAMTLTFGRLAQYIHFVADLGVNTVVLQRLLHNFPGLDVLDVLNSLSQEEVDDTITRAIDAARIRQVNLGILIGAPRSFQFTKITFRHFKQYYLDRAVIVRFPRICHYVATYLKIDPDGEVYPCCRAPRELSMGNIRKISFDEIWNGNTYQELREEMYTGRLRACCRECTIQEYVANVYRSFFESFEQKPLLHLS
jgi:radical SAM protein with 4Fe4S-binding SPASM domain